MFVVSKFYARFARRTKSFRKTTSWWKVLKVSWHPISGEKKIVKLLHFPNISPTEQKRLLMSDSESGSASEKDPKQAMAPTGSEGLNHKHPRKKSWTKRSLDMQRKISLSKLKDEKQELDAKSRSSQSPDVEHQPTAMHVAKHHSLPPKLKGRSPRSHKVSDGYDQYLKQYLLQVPMPKDYGEPSSDDLSSEWDSDVTDNKNVETIKESKVKSAFKFVKLFCITFPLSQSSIGWRKLRNIVQWTPFFQTNTNKQRYPWVQLAGHQGSFKAGSDPGTVLKKLTPKEEICFKKLMQDNLRPYVPEFKGVVNGEDDECEKRALCRLQSMLTSRHF